MRKIRLLSVFMAVLWATIAQATTVVKFSDDLSTAPATNWGFSGTAGGSMTYDGTNQLEQFRWNTTNSATRSITTVTAGTDNKVTYEMIVKYYTSGSSSNPGCWYLLDASGNAITGICFFRSSSQWRIGRATTYTGPGSPTVNPTVQDYLAADAPIAKITIVMDFTAKTLTYTAITGSWNALTKTWTDGSTSVTATTNLGFINTAATDFTTFYMNYRRAATASGTNGFDLYKVSVSRDEVASTANVTVKYKDQDGNYFKSDEVTTNQIVGNAYNATNAQKASSIVGENYYVLDPSSATNISSVDAAGSTLELLFRRQQNVSSMIWNGTSDANGNLWSEWYQNFTNNSTAFGYQSGSNVTFDASAANTAISVNDAISMGAGNMTISAPNYAFTGTGAISGTGAMNINLNASDALTLGVTNSLSGGTTITGGNITLSKTGVIGGSTLSIGNSTLNAGASSINIPSATLNASTTINASTYSGTTLSGLTIPAGIKATLTGAFNTSNANNTFAFAASGTLSAGSELELNGTGTTENKFGMTAASTSYLANTKVTLKGNAFLFINANQGAATTINVGTLAGEATTKLGWGTSSGLDRTITWSVGALNENSEFAGTITNTGGYAGSGSMYIGNLTNLTKVGTGILTLSGASTHNGAVAVSEGTINVTGSLGSGATVTVASGATLDGTGTISGATTIDGTIKGSLNFNGAVTLNSGATVNTVASINLGTAATLTAASASTTLGAINISSNATSAGKINLQDGATIPALTITSAATPDLNKTFQIVNATT
ncbi:MAG: autotransporter-associated beta strand repeat-containing protein, partial [Bacteroidota bacterium]|nr:autotransporter-associated beta strand repeat-containing protein [Bacteroidota bacterium]